MERLTDKGVRRLDARAAVVTLDVLERTGPAILTAARAPP